MDKQVQKKLELFRSRPWRSKKMEGYFGRMDHDNLHPVWDDNVADVLLAQGFHIETAPRSIYRVDKLFEALSTFAPGTIPSPRRSASYSMGLALAWKCFGCHGDKAKLSVLPLTPATIDSITSNPGGSAGLTNFGFSKAESKTRALERGLQTLHRKLQPEPCLAFARTSGNDKTRLVWGFPYSMTVIEGLVAKPLIEEFKGGGTPMAFAMSSMSLGAKLRVASYHRRFFYSLDMSRFDSTISAELINHAFDILESWFDLDKVEPVSGLTVKEIFNTIRYYFITTPIVMPDRKVYIGKCHGVPSGSYFTQIVDSIVNTIIAGAVSHRFALHIDRNELFVLGDDLGFWTNRLISLDRIATWVNDNFHVKLHGSEKSKIYGCHEPVHYLGRNWRDGLPSLDTEEILKKIAQPERFRKYSDDPVLRQKQVRMLLLAYASEYLEGWNIAYKALIPRPMWYGNGGSNIDVNTYCDVNGRVIRFDNEHMSGRMRYMRKYVYGQKKSDIPVTMGQFFT